MIEKREEKRDNEVGGGIYKRDERKERRAQRNTGTIEGTEYRVGGRRGKWLP